MAAISQPAPLAGESLLEKLPTELLEKVLLEVVNGVTSPSEYTGNRPNLLRCNLEITSGTSIASLLLKHRLVSRTIRMNSWRSLAKVLGETIFDMCSKESMANLVALTSCMSLAPWINKLTVSCFKVKKTYPFSDCILEYEEGYDNAVAHLGSVCQMDISRLRDLDETWYNNTWISPVAAPKAVSDRDSHQLGINFEFEQGLKYMVSACLACLANLDNVCYFYEMYHVPARFRKLANRYESFSKFAFNVAARHNGEAGTDLGFRLLMEIMSIAKSQPKRLCLAVNIEDPHYFLASSWKTTSCLRRVEELTLIDPGIVPQAWRRPSSTVSAVPISKASFPNLTSLSVKLGNVDITLRNRNLLLCQVLDVPELRHVSITGGDQTDPRLLGFLELIEGPIRSVSLRDMRAVSYEPILKVLQSLELDVLAIHDRYGIWWEGDTYDEREFRGVPKGFLESVAKSGIFGPELLDEELEDELEVELEEGLEE
ncbi:hypothetical protein HBI56_210430 [Parastagonospora nodorum]|nr:hypothetical protein HBI56_210430 [Parastagonospora nodorum]